ncbi:hypothetical protein ACLBX9_03015 [Methylobacterium sp. A49B]
MNNTQCREWLTVNGNGQDYSLLGNAKIVDKSLTQTPHSPNEIAGRSKDGVYDVPKPIGRNVADRIKKGSPEDNFETKSLMTYFIVIGRPSDFGRATQPWAGQATVVEDEPQTGVAQDEAQEGGVAIDNGNTAPDTVTETSNEEDRNSEEIQPSPKTSIIKKWVDLFKQKISKFSFLTFVFGFVIGFLVASALFLRAH